MSFLEVGEERLDVDGEVSLVRRDEILDVGAQHGAPLAVLLDDRVVRDDGLGLGPGGLGGRVDLVPGLVDLDVGIALVEGEKGLRVLAGGGQAAGLIGALRAITRVEGDHDLLPVRSRCRHPVVGVAGIPQRRVVVGHVAGVLDPEHFVVGIGEHGAALVGDPGDEPGAGTRGPRGEGDEHGEQDGGKSDSEPHAIPRSNRFRCRRRTTTPLPAAADSSAARALYARVKRRPATGEADSSSRAASSAAAASIAAIRSGVMAVSSSFSLSH
jgi:hypothetical protein